MKTPGEGELLQGARAFEPGALAEIYDRYSPGLYAYAMRLTGDLPGEQLGYATCPADEQNTSVVTVTGMLFA